MSISPKSLPIYSLPADDNDIAYNSDKMAPYSPTPGSLLPGPISSASPRRSARRVSYTIKNRLSRHSLPLSIGLFITTMLLYITYSGGNGMPSFSLDERSGGQQKTFNDGGFVRENNGLSFLEEHEDELIAEDDQFWDEHRAKSEEEKKEMEKMEARRKDVERTNKRHSLRALIWWISQGGILPSDYELPDKEDVLKMGSRGMERVLEDLDNGVPGDEIFQEGWAEFAKDRYQVTVFSKVSSVHFACCVLVLLGLTRAYRHSARTRRTQRAFWSSTASRLRPISSNSTVAVSPSVLFIGMLLVVSACTDTLSSGHVQAANITPTPDGPPDSTQHSARFRVDWRLR